MLGRSPAPFEISPIRSNSDQQRELIAGFPRRRSAELYESK